MIIIVIVATATIFNVLYFIAPLFPVASFRFCFFPLGLSSCWATSGTMVVTQVVAVADQANTMEKVTAVSTCELYEKVNGRIETDTIGRHGFSASHSTDNFQASALGSQCRFLLPYVGLCGNIRDSNVLSCGVVEGSATSKPDQVS